MQPAQLRGEFDGSSMGIEGEWDVARPFRLVGEFDGSVILLLGGQDGPIRMYTPDGDYIVIDGGDAISIT